MSGKNLNERTLVAIHLFTFFTLKTIRPHAHTHTHLWSSLYALTFGPESRLLKWPPCSSGLNKRTMVLLIISLFWFGWEHKPQDVKQNIDFLSISFHEQNNNNVNQCKLSAQCIYNGLCLLASHIYNFCSFFLDLSRWLTRQWLVEEC